MNIVSGLRVIEGFVIANFLSEAGGNALAVDSLFGLYMTLLTTTTATFVTTIPTVMIGQSDGTGGERTGIMISWLGTGRININKAMSLYLKLMNMPADGIRQATQVCVSQLMDMKKNLKCGAMSILEYCWLPA